MKKKVLIVIQQLRRGGVEVAAVNFASHLDQNKYDFTYYLQHIDCEQDEKLLKIIKENHSHVIVKPDSARGYIGGFKDAVRIMRQTKFDIVHSHVMFYNGIIISAAKLCGVKKRISHSHAKMWNKKENVAFKFYRAMMRKLINAFATDKLACSQEAGEYMYGKRQYQKQGIFIANGIETAHYAFCKKTRNEKRAELGIKENEILVGHIGTIYRIKNQLFLAEIFAKMLKNNINAKLMLVGEKYDIKDLNEKISRLNIADKVVATGARNDIPELLQAFDIMIFPSLVEALPVSLIEAQAAGLPCLISDRVTKDVKFNNNIEFMPLEENAEKWADKAFSMLGGNREAVDLTDLKKTYDIKEVANKLEKIYSDG